LGPQKTVTDPGSISAFTLCQ